MVHPSDVHITQGRDGGGFRISTKFLLKYRMEKVLGGDWCVRREGVNFRTSCVVKKSDLYTL